MPKNPNRLDDLSERFDDLGELIELCSEGPDRTELEDSSFRIARERRRACRINLR